MHSLIGAIGSPTNQTHTDGIYLGVARDLEWIVALR